MVKRIDEFQPPTKFCIIAVNYHHNFLERSPASSSIVKKTNAVHYVHYIICPSYKRLVGKHALINLLFVHVKLIFGVVKESVLGFIILPILQTLIDLEKQVFHCILLVPV